MLPLVYLIRHGETDWARLGRHTSHTDVPLTSAGENEARAVGCRLSGVAFARILSSPRQRALRTCEIAGFADRAEVEPAAREWEYGDYEGLRSSEILRARPDWSIYRDGCPNGESPAQLAARADALIIRLRAMEGAVALFSHGHFLRVLAVRWIALPIETAQRFTVDTASIGVLAFGQEDVNRPVIARWNEKAGG